MRSLTDHPVITREAAQLLIGCGVHLVGVDFPSVDVPPFETHLELLGHGVLIVENLTRLEEIRGNTFHFTALPLKIVGRDGSPVRAIAAE
jgi:kynurenine formamidase